MMYGSLEMYSDIDEYLHGKPEPTGNKYEDERTDRELINESLMEAKENGTEISNSDFVCF